MTASKQQRALKLGAIFRHGKVLCGFIVLLAYGYIAVAAVITLDPALIADDAITVPVVLYGEGNDPVSGIQFDVRFDDEAFALVGVETGDAAASADKVAVYNDAISGVTRVLIAGMNQTSIPDGLVANVILAPIDGADASQPFIIESCLLSDPYGNSLDTIVENAYLEEEAGQEPSQQAISEKNAAEYEASNTPGSDTALEASTSVGPPHRFLRRTRTFAL